MWILSKIFFWYQNIFNFWTIFLFQSYTRFQISIIIIGIIFRGLYGTFRGFSIYFSLVGCMFYVGVACVWRREYRSPNWFNLVSTIKPILTIFCSISQFFTCVMIFIICGILLIVFNSYKFNVIEKYDFISHNRFPHKYYPICSSTWGDMSIDEIAFLSTIAYRYE